YMGASGAHVVLAVMLATIFLLGPGGPASVLAAATVCVPTWFCLGRCCRQVLLSWRLSERKSVISVSRLAPQVSFIQRPVSRKLPRRRVLTYVKSILSALRFPSFATQC